MYHLRHPDLDFWIDVRMRESDGAGWRSRTWRMISPDRRESFRRVAVRHRHADRRLAEVMPTSLWSPGVPPGP
jgi:hypothetical protein